MTSPLFYSFRRCPYAMRARLALASADVKVELREILLRDKPQAFLDTSPSATVPCLKDAAGTLDESYDIMLWALGKNDPEGWLDIPDRGHDLIKACDGEFKTALDHYKYNSHHGGVNIDAERATAGQFLNQLEAQLDGKLWLFGDKPALADMAILPFIRQFAHVDLAWFTDQPWPDVIRWLEAFKTSRRFANIMNKYPQWQDGDTPLIFPA